MSQKYKNNIGDDNIPSEIPQNQDEELKYNEVSSCKKINMDNGQISEYIYDIIKECQSEMGIPIFDINDFCYTNVEEYLKYINT